MTDVADKLACFQASTGLNDTDLCRDILSAHGWDLEQAISSFTSTSTSNSNKQKPATTSGTVVTGRVQSSGLIAAGVAGPLGVAWKLAKLPFSVTRASLGLASGAFGLGLWVAGGVLSYTLGTMGLANIGRISEAVDFLSDFENQYGKRHPTFVSEGFTAALQLSRRMFKLLFVYLHSPDHPDTPAFCKRTLCSEVISSFVNENFVAWGDSIRANEGLKMSKNLKASTFPFCAVVMAATGQKMSLLRQFEGPRSPEEMLTELQTVLEENSPALVAAEEQDASYRAELEANQAKEQQKKEDQNQPETEEAALVKLCEEKALSLGPEPENGPDVTRVLVRLPNGERRGRRFGCGVMLQSVYDFVDSSGCLEAGSYSLVTFFPRVVYGRDKLSSTIEELGLHHQASLFVELNS